MTGTTFSSDRTNYLVYLDHCSTTAMARDSSVSWANSTTSTRMSESLFHTRYASHTNPRTSDDPLNGHVEELDLGSDEDEEDDEPALPPAKLKGKKSKQHGRPLKIIPTASDESSSSEDEDEDEDGGERITMKNMERRSRALDARSTHEAALDAEEMQRAELEGQESEDDLGDAQDVEMNEEGEGEEGGALPTAEERDEEKKRGGPDVHTVQRRMRECVRVLGDFKKLGAKGRWVMFAWVQEFTLNVLIAGHGQSMLRSWSLTSRATTVTTTSSRRSYSNFSRLLR